MPIRDINMEAADDKTLRLASPEVNADLLDGLLAYQRMLLEELADATVPAAERLDRGRAKALAQSGIPAAKLHRLEAFVRDVAAKVLVRQRLEKRQAELSQSQAKNPLEQKRRDELAKELRTRDPLPLLRRRYGDAAVDLVLARLDALLDVHQALERAIRELT